MGIFGFRFFFLQRLCLVFQRTCSPERENEELIQKEELKFKDKEVV